MRRTGVNRVSESVDPVIISVPTARKRLREQGEVVVFGPSERTTRTAWWHESTTGPREGEVIIKHVQEIDCELQWVDGELLKRSGFETYDDWKAAIRERHGWEPPGGHLYRVRSILSTMEPYALLDELTGRDAERLRLEALHVDHHVPGDTLGFINKTAVLGGGPDHFVVHFYHHDPNARGPAVQLIDRSTAQQLVSLWIAIEFEEIKPSDPVDLVPPDWVAEYDADSYDSHNLLPTPEDWELVNVEGRTIEWRRPPQPARDAEYWEEHDIWRPENVAQTTSADGYDDQFGTLDTVIRGFDVDREPVFKVTDSERNDRLATIAEILARVARGEPYADVEPSTGTGLETSSATIPPEDSTAFDEYLEEFEFDR